MAKRSSTGLFAAAEAEAGHEIGKDEFERQLEPLRIDLLNLQYDLRKADFAVILILAGIDRPGAVDLLHTLNEWLDARYLQTHVIFGSSSRTEEERDRPPAWRYWRRFPPAGRIGVFVGGWATELAAGALDHELDEAAVESQIERIANAEQALANAGTLLLKFWLHLPRKVLDKRVARAKKKPKENWEIGDRDRELLDRYDETLDVVERIVRRTSTSTAPWTILESTDRRYRNLTVGRGIAEALERRLAEGRPEASAPVGAASPADGQLVLDRVDLSKTLDKPAYEKELERHQARINDLFRRADRLGVGCVMAFEGWDAAGKGGAIRRLTRAIPVQTQRVIPIAAPSEEERAHHYLWRFWREVPSRGRTVIFDRSWYGRVLVERVEGFASEGEWRRAYEEINDFEQNLVDFGHVVLKFWLHIDPDEQLRRFEQRSETPYKKYKLTDEDYRNREKWADYALAVHDMVAATSTSTAPWHLVAANDKRWARIQVLERAGDAMQARLDAMKRRKKSKKGKKDRGAG